jgi:hypothetical protein
MRWTIRRKSSSLGMFRCIPRTYSIIYNHLCLGMPESSPYSSTNMKLSPSYSILPIHMICIMLTCIIYMSWFYIFLVLLGSLFHFYCFFTLTCKLKTTKIVSFLLLLCLVLYFDFIWFFTFDFWFRVFLAVASMFRSCLASGILVYQK